MASALDKAFKDIAEAGERNARKLHGDEGYERLMAAHKTALAEAAAKCDAAIERDAESAARARAHFREQRERYSCEDNDYRPEARMRHPDYSHEHSTYRVVNGSVA